ncbi:MAG: tetratricopeptide repeat protein [Acaryochloridaceae cyanobacterium CSU_3_4]|nr:tetratricopeptide repeat protein [Acaryochloridaceae cyanobacterium CSU_3_4]
MRRKQTHVYLATGIAIFLLGLSCIRTTPIFAQEASNPQTNPHFAAALSRLDQKDLQGAMQELNQAILLDPSLADAYSLRAILHLDNKNYQKALVDFTEVTRLRPQSAEAYVNLAKSQLVFKDYRAALQSATKATQLEPQNQNALLLVQLIQRILESSGMVEK